MATGLVKVGVRPSLPVAGVNFILGNNLAGGKILPILELLESPELVQPDELVQRYPLIFPACAVTRAQSRKLGDVVDLSDSFMVPSLTEDPKPCPNKSSELEVLVSGDKTTSLLPLSITHSQLELAQIEDVTLKKCFAAITRSPSSLNMYVMDGDLLLRRWTPHPSLNTESSVNQIVIPVPYRPKVLSLAHNT